VSFLKRTASLVARNTLGRMPASSAALNGPLAIEGGKPVRDIRFKPWPGDDSGRLLQWLTSVGPALRRVFLSGIEGLPQARQKEFAARWAEYCGCKHGLLLPHGTDALRFALAAAFDHDGLEYGGEVIVPNLTFIASATAALDRRFGIALVDVDPGTLNIDPRRVEEAVIPGKTKAIVPVHQFGQPADMTALRAIANRHGLKIIEDAAQAHGSEWETGRSGSLGDAAAFSFQSAKNLSSGEGGILTTNDTTLFDRAHQMHNAGRDVHSGGRWEHATLGWNCRPTEYQAALLLHRFGRFEELQEIRRKNFEALRAFLAGVRSVKALDVHPGVRRHGMYMFVLRYHPEHCGGLSLEEFIRAARAEGVPIHRCYAATIANQKAIRDLQVRRPDYIRVLPTPVSDQAVEVILYIANSIFLSDRSGMEDIAAAFAKIERRYDKA
jgi:dTDP-4-amino-4,6-dideoxygalactose transaminase